MSGRRGMIERYGNEGIYRKVFASGDAAYQTPNDADVVYASGAAIAGTVYLPPVATYRGRILHIEAISVTTGNVTVKPYQQSDATPGDKPDSGIYAAGGAGASTSQVLASAGAFTTLYSTGEKWIALAYDLNLGA